jgi:hypothetical protein
MTQQALLLVGSAKRPRSTSQSLGTYLLERLQEREWETETILLHRALCSEERQGELLAAVDRADLILFAFPLYVDTLPALATRALELVAAHRRDVDPPLDQRLVAIANCGFPEAQHNDTALAICQRFATETGFEWAGGLSLGGGQAINGRPLPDMGGMVRHVTQALDLTAEALAAGRPVPEEAVGLMARQFIPAWLYILMGGIGWRQQARQYGVQRQLKARPFEV